MCPSVIGVKYYNELPIQITNAKNYNCFKKYLKEKILNEYSKSNMNDC